MTGIFVGIILISSNPKQNKVLRLSTDVDACRDTLQGVDEFLLI